MRIQNNITAMNTHRMYTINNENVAKNAEKLSSGYRINRAGDDAAGLAISEKMRSQIRGLNMATKNSQDAISLVQTAEGALQETQNMLQRMNELAVQAATGTNETLDRNALAKEFEQLKREINDIAEQTNFNNMKILDGSLSYTGYVRSAATAGVTATVEDMTALASKDPVTMGAFVDGTGTDGKGQAAKMSIAVDGLTNKFQMTQVGGSDARVVDGATLTKAGQGFANVNLGFVMDGVTDEDGNFKIDLFKDVTWAGSSDTAADTNTLGKALETALNKNGDFKASYVAKWTGSSLEIKELESTRSTTAATLGNITKEGTEGKGPVTELTGKPSVTIDVTSDLPNGTAIAANTGKPVTAANGTQTTIDYTMANDIDTKTGEKYTFTFSTSTDGVPDTFEIEGQTGKKLHQLITEKFDSTNGEKLKVNGHEVSVEYNGTDLVFHTTSNGTNPLGTTAVKLTMNKTGATQTGLGSFEAGKVATNPADSVASTKEWKIAFPGSEPKAPEKPNANASDADKAKYTEDMAKYTADKAAYDASVDAGIKNGATLTIGGNTYKFSTATKIADGETVPNLGENDFNDGARLAEIITRDANGQYEATWDDKTGTLKVTGLQQGNAATQAEIAEGQFTKFGDVKGLELDWNQSTPDAGKKTTVEFDFAKMQEGDAVNIKIGDKTITVEKIAGDDRKAFMDRIQGTLEDQIKDDRVKVKGNALISEGPKVEVDMKLAKDALTDVKETNAVRIQVGALENEQLSISIDSMNTKGLGLDDAFLMSQNNPMNAATLDQDAAGDAITKVRNAINKVSDQRATLGAMQNRLDHKIANLKVSSENLSAAESRIRDVDMASEMTEFTKNNILSQAATAMLAQANSLPQNVLSLLG